MTTAPYDPRSGNTPDAKPLDLAGMRYQAQYNPQAPANPVTYDTERIYDNRGKLVEVYTEGPNAGRGVDTGELVIQGEAPKGTIEGVPGSGTSLTGGGTSITTGGENGLSDQEKANRQSAYDILLTEFTKYGLQSLVTDVKDLLINRTPASQIPLALQNTDAYQQRFSANQDRIKAGLRALSPFEYVSNEDAL